MKSTNKDSPLVSIITANYNKADFIAETIRSVLAQTYSHWELILIDDCSTDSSVQVITPFLHDDRIRLVRNESNRGGNFSRNYGLGQCQGDYVIFLDADDLLASFCLQTRVEAARQFMAGNLFVFSMGVFYTKPGDTVADWMPVSHQPLTDFLQHKLPWSILQPLWKKDFLQQLGGFDESFLRLQDVELNTRALLSKTVNVKLLPGVPDCYYRIDEVRKNFNTFDFLMRWCTSAVQYVQKFRPLVTDPLRPWLMGTIYETYLNLLYYRKTGKISDAELKQLEAVLLSGEAERELNAFKNLLFSLSRFYNLKKFRIPGINKLIKRLITL